MARTFFTIRKARTSFAIYKDVRTGSKRTQTRIDSPELNTINVNFKRELKGPLARSLVIEKYLKLVKALQQSLYFAQGERPPAVFLDDNMAIAQTYYNKNLKHKKTKDKGASFREFRRAIEAIGNLPLLTSSAADLGTALAKFPNNKQRRIASKLNKLLAFSKSEVRIAKDKKQRPIPKYLTDSEFTLVLAHIADRHVKAVLACAFYSGCRLGELFALEEDDFINGVINVNKQMLRPDTVKGRGSTAIAPTKNEEQRRVVPFPSFSTWFTELQKVPKNLRSTKFAELLKQACRKTFPNKPNKHLVAHDLRHSFAKALINKGLNLTFVAKQLGNRIEVAQEYYAGYVNDDENIQLLKEKLKA